MSSFSTTRRKFTVAAAAAAATAIIRPAETVAQAASSQTGLVDQVNSSLAKLPPQAQAEVEMKFAEVIRKYGDRLSDEQKADVRKVLAETQEGLEKMRAFALDNDDQPATVFRASRDDAQPGSGSERGSK